MKDIFLVEGNWFKMEDLICINEWRIKIFVNLNEYWINKNNFYLGGLKFKYKVKI